MGQHPEYYHLINKKEDLGSLKLLFDLARNFSMICCFLLENDDLLPKKDFLGAYQFQSKFC